MIKILRELTTQIVGLYYAAEINKSATMLKAAQEVCKAYETILKHSKEAQKIIGLDIEVSNNFGLDRSYYTIEEMKKRAYDMVNESKTIKQ